MMGVGENYRGMLSLPSVMEPSHSWHKGHRTPQLALLKALCRTLSLWLGLYPSDSTTSDKKE